MKKSFPININGQIFYIDEDAYTLLQNYLKQLRATFTGEEGAEIVDDIESRIHEHFGEKVVDGIAVITLDDVNTVIETMGRPEQLDEASASADAGCDDTNNAGAEVDSPESSGENTRRPGTMPPPSDDSVRSFFSTGLGGRKRLFRNMQNKVLGGVFGGLAVFLGWNASVMRVLIVLLLLWLTFIMNVFWPWVIFYLILWMIIPAATTSRHILEMQGKPVNVDTVGRTVMQTPPPYDGSAGVQKSEGVISSIISVFGKCLMGFVGLVSTVVVISIIIVVISMLVLLSTNSIFDFSASFPDVALPRLFFMPQMLSAVTIAWSMVFLIPAVALVWTACCVIFNVSAASRSTKITAIVLELVFIITAIVLTVVCGAPIHFPFSPVSISLAVGVPMLIN